MENFASHVAVAATTFAVTNIDDLLILSIYFGNPVFKKINVIAGQYIGVLTLTVLSLIGFLLGNIVSSERIGLLGLFPLFLGTKDLISLLSNSDDNEETVDPSKTKSKFQIVNVALITIANGGDNLGVYIPLFANIERGALTIYVFVFAIMIAFWCALALYFVKHPIIKNAFGKYGHIMLPFCLILLGIWIILKSKVYTIFM